MEISRRIKSTGPGWEHIVAPLIAYCAAHNLEILQIKEKFGLLRFYWRYSDDTVDPVTFDNLIGAAELQSEQTCEWCGAPGRPRKTNWRKTLCDTHEKEWNDGKRWWD